jgi:hypothetical protein
MGNKNVVGRKNVDSISLDSLSTFISSNEESNLGSSRKYLLRSAKKYGLESEEFGVEGGLG